MGLLPEADLRTLWEGCTNGSDQGINAPESRSWPFANGRRRDARGCFRSTRNYLDTQGKSSLNGFNPLIGPDT